MIGGPLGRRPPEELEFKQVLLWEEMGEIAKRTENEGVFLEWQVIKWDGQRGEGWGHV